jgi:hypothetical protein
MEVHFTPETEKKLKDLSAQSGRRIDDFVEDATAAYVDGLLRTRDMLNSRYDDLKSGRAKLIDGEEAFARLKAKTDAAQPSGMSVYALHPEASRTWTTYADTLHRTTRMPPTGR